MEIAKFIKRRRESKGIGPVEFAHLLGISYFCVHAWEDGRRIPRKNIIRELARALGVDPEVLLIMRAADMSKRAAA